LTNLVIISRPNCPNYSKELQTFLINKSIQNLTKGKIVELKDIPLFDISSTRIRISLQQNMRINFLVTEQVRQFIVQTLNN